MQAHKIKLVQESFETIAAAGPKASEIFYAELFAIDPALRSMFSGGMEDRQRNLFLALSLMVRALHTPEKVQNEVQKLAMRHLEYSVRAEHYTYVGNALLRMLRKVLGPEFTPELCEAWTEAFRAIARMMKEAAYGRPPALAGLIH